MNYFNPTALEHVNQAKGHRLREAAFVAAAPAALAVIEIFHPHPHSWWSLDVQTWMTVHYVQVPLFALSALALARLVRPRTDMEAQLCRIALFVFALCFMVFDTAAGLVVGSLVEAAHASGRPGAWQAPIEAVWTHPVFGGTSRPLLALVGRLALSVATVSAAMSLYRSGRPWWPVLLLALSGCVMYVLPGHSWPGGPLTFGAMAVAIAWLQWCAPDVSDGGNGGLRSG